MTKDGRPSLITDIRLFVGEHYTSSSYLKGQEEAVAFGRRIAFFLNGEGFSLGSFPALYVLFNPSMEPGSVRVTNDGGDWWHRYVHVGVAEDFLNDSDVFNTLANGIVDALCAIRPDQEGVVRRVAETIREHGANQRFLLKRSETAKLIVEISFNIAAWPQPSQLFIAHIEKTNPIYREADPIDLGNHLEGFDLVAGVRLIDAANLTERHRPALSKLVKRRG